MTDLTIIYWSGSLAIPNLYKQRKRLQKNKVTLYDLALAAYLSRSSNCRATGLDHKFQVVGENCIQIGR